MISPAINNQGNQANHKNQGADNVPVLRFPEFKGEWKKKRFDEIFLFSIGKNIKQNEASPEFITPCVRYGELYHMYNEVINEVTNKTNLNKSEILFSDGDEKKASYYQNEFKKRFK